MPKMLKIRLTDVAVQKMRPPAAGRLEVLDEIVPRLALRITERGHKSWSLGYRYNGKNKRMTLGNYPAFGVGEARDAARAAQRQVARGEDPGYMKREKIQVQRKCTFEAVFNEYIDKYAKPKNRTWKQKKRLIEADALPLWKDMPIDCIKKKDIIALRNKVMNRGKPYAANNIFSVLRKLFNWAAEQDYIEFSPCSHIPLPITPVERDRVLLDAEIKAIWEACDLENYPFGKLIQFLLLTGQRRAEASRLRWKEIDLKEKVWRLPRERVKVNRAHEVPLSTLAIELLESLPRFGNDGENDGERYVFTTTGGKKAFAGFGKCKKRLDTMAEVEGWRIHDLRRTMATGLARLGVPVSTISQVLNHAQGGVTWIYNRHSYLPEKTEALQKWANRIAEILSEKA